jgi:hypothetical protein
MTFNLKAPNKDLTILFENIKDEVAKQGGHLVGDTSSGTIEKNTAFGLVKISYERQGDYYNIAKTVGPSYMSDDMVKLEMQNYFRGY